MEVISQLYLNFTGSSTGLDTTGGAIKIFSSSKEMHGLYYPSFYGDGDSKAYHAVKDIYGPIKPIKEFERVVQKIQKDWEENRNSLTLKLTQYKTIL